MYNLSTDGKIADVRGQFYAQEHVKVPSDSLEVTSKKPQEGLKRLVYRVCLIAEGKSKMFRKLSLWKFLEPGPA